MTSPADSEESSLTEEPLPIQYVIVPAPSDLKIINPPQLITNETAPFTFQNSPYQLSMGSSLIQIQPNTFQMASPGIQITPNMPQLTPKPMPGNLKEIQTTLNSLQGNIQINDTASGQISMMLQSIQSTLDKILISQKGEVNETPKLPQYPMNATPQLLQSSIAPQSFQSIPQKFQNYVLFPQKLEPQTIQMLNNPPIVASNLNLCKKPSKIYKPAMGDILEYSGSPALRTRTKSRLTTTQKPELCEMPLKSKLPRTSTTPKIMLPKKQPIVLLKRIPAILKKNHASKDISPILEETTHKGLKALKKPHATLERSLMTLEKTIMVLEDSVSEDSISKEKLSMPSIAIPSSPDDMSSTRDKNTMTPEGVSTALSDISSMFIKNPSSPESLSIACQTTPEKISSQENSTESEKNVSKTKLQNKFISLEETSTPTQAPNNMITEEPLKLPSEIPILPQETDIEFQGVKLSDCQFVISEVSTGLENPANLQAPEIEKMLKKFVKTRVMEPELFQYLISTQQISIKQEVEMVASKSKDSVCKMPIPAPSKMAISRSVDDDHCYENPEIVKLERENVSLQIAQEKDIDMVFQKQMEEEAAYLEMELLKKKLSAKVKNTKMTHEEPLNNTQKGEHTMGQISKLKPEIEKTFFKLPTQEEQECYKQKLLQEKKLRLVTIGQEEEKQVAEFKKNLVFIDHPNFPNCFKYIQVSETVFRCNIKDMSDIELWWIEFRQKNKFLWMKDYIERPSEDKIKKPRRVASAKFFCSFRSRVQKVKDSDQRLYKCKAQINIGIRNCVNMNKKRDLYLLAGYPSIIYFKNEHNHPTDTEEVIAGLKPFPKIKRHIEQYFDDGLNSQQAYERFQVEAPKDICKDPAKLEDPRWNPSLKKFKSMWKNWRKKNGIKLNTRYSKPLYTRIRKEFEKYFMNGLATKEAYEYHKSLIATGRIENIRLPEVGSIKAWYTAWKRKVNLLPPKTPTKRSHDENSVNESKRQKNNQSKKRKENLPSPSPIRDESYTCNQDEYVLEFDTHEDVYEDTKHDENLFLLLINLLNTKYNNLGCSSSLLHLFMERINNCNTTEDLEGLIGNICGDEQYIAIEKLNTFK